MTSPASQPRFPAADLLTILGIFALGGAGYLCDSQSPAIVPFLWIFGLAFSSALMVLGCLIFRDAVVFRTQGWPAGVLFLILPLIVWLLYSIGLKMISLYEPQTLQ
jgi:hypothetical protein